MLSPIFCLGAINLDLKFQVDDLESFLKDWGTGLTRGGEEAVSREQEARLTALLARYGQPAGRFGGGMAANQAKAGHAVAAFDLSAAALDRAGSAGCTPVASVAEAVRDAEVVILSLIHI